MTTRAHQHTCTIAARRKKIASIYAVARYRLRVEAAPETGLKVVSQLILTMPRDKCGPWIGGLDDCPDGTLSNAFGRPGPSGLSRLAGLFSAPLSFCAHTHICTSALVPMCTLLILLQPICWITKPSAQKLHAKPKSATDLTTGTPLSDIILRRQPRRSPGPTAATSAASAYTCEVPPNPVCRISPRAGLSQGPRRFTGPQSRSPSEIAL